MTSGGIERSNTEMEVHPVPSERLGPAIMVCIIETNQLLRIADPVVNERQCGR